MIKTFHVNSNAQVADVFTKAFGFNSFMRLIQKLGLRDIFMTQQLVNKLQSDTQLQVHDPPIQDLRGSIKLEESQHWQHGENRAQQAQQKERKAQGNYTCQRERKKQLEATGVWIKEETSKKKNKMEGTDVTL